MEKGKWFSKSDIFLIIGLLAAAFLTMLFYSINWGEREAVKAEILLNGKVVKEVSLEKDTIFSIHERENVVFEVKDGKIRISESDCPDKICVHTGFISRPMQTAVCLPNAISVRITGEDEYKIDAVTG